MRLVALQTGLVCALSTLSFALAQAPGDVPAQDQSIRTPAADFRLHLKYGVFDPLLGAPMVPEVLLARADTNLYIVQYPYAFTDADRAALRDLGVKLYSPLPHNALIVRMDMATAAAVAATPGVRWVGPYHPAYRLEAELITEIATGAPMPTRKYNMVMADKRNDKDALQRKVEALGGKVVDRQDGSILFTVELSGAQLVQAARLDEVLWIDRWTPSGQDMDNARSAQGSNYIETQAGYTGAGVRGHVYEGVEYNHSDFRFAMTNVLSGGQADDHGHCTAGIIFGDGTSGPQARGHAPDARGYYTNNGTVTSGYSRNQVIDAVVNTHSCMFTTASWGGNQTTAYTSISADADDIVFDHRIPWTQSMSNLGTQSVRPEAWAKNVISIGGMYHYNNSTTSDDAWGGGGSVGPAADGRIKPDLCNFYDAVWTSDRTGAAGYSAGNSTTGFGGTSAATPITAGLNALAIQMYTDHILNNVPRVMGGTRFENRPYAQTLKALQIACASMYPFGTAAGQSTRYRGGYGYANVRTIYDRRDRMMIIPEDVPITQGSTHSYFVDVEFGAGTLKVCMSYLDPKGSVAASIDRINDLTLRVIHPNGTTAYWGNQGLTAGNTSATGGSANTLDTVECVIVSNPIIGRWRIEVTAPTIAEDAHIATAATDATYALVVNGGARGFSGCARYIPDTDAAAGTVNVVPFGTSNPSALNSTFANNNGGSVGGAVYFNLTATTNAYLHGIDLNTAIGAGTEIHADIYYRNGTYAGNEGSMAGWNAWTAAHGSAAAVGTASTLDFDRGVYLAANTTYGIAVVARNFAHAYTSGANVYSNADLTLATGSASNAPFGTAIAGRTINATLRYQVDDAAWHNQIYQTVLRSQDLGPAGSITGLAFAPSTTGQHFNRALTIRMAHRSAGYSLSTTFATNISGSTTVLSESYYTWHTVANSWHEIGLTAPFAYNGTSDVVVEIYARGNHSSTGTAGGFHRGDEPRLYSAGFGFASIPTTGTLNTGGTKMRAEFECANSGHFGTSCGPAIADAVSTPQVNSSAYSFHMHNGVPNSGAVIVLGLNQTTTNLTSYGFTNCTSWNDNVASVFKVASAAGYAFHNLTVPATTAFNGLKIYGHWANLDQSQPGGITFTNYIRAVIGSLNP